MGQRLCDLLEDDYLCWYDVPIGPRHQHPDFLVLHPARGILILEVNDWHLKTIRDASPIRAVDRGQIPRAQYGAVLIDEGHDFAPDWLKLAVQMLDPATNHLLLLYDDAQSIYGDKRAKSFSFRSLGVAAAGRTKILKRNYRNTREILT